jgi:tRNA1(Val) A37 N6-methylase TrmN6
MLTNVYGGFIVDTTNVTQDYLLGGKISIRQPAHGYRVAIDPVFLASSIQAEEGDTILDIGAGVGAASLCLAYRLPLVKVTGLEIQRGMLKLASDNIALNDLRGRVEMLHGDLTSPPPRLAAGTFAHVMSNPPYIEAFRGNPSPHEGKQTSHMESSATLELWAKFSLLMVRPKGTITFIHRADRLDHILTLFAGKVGEVTVYPLWPGKDKPAKRVLVRARKNSQAPMSLLPGMQLHDLQGRYTLEADRILRNGAGLDW